MVAGGHATVTITDNDFPPPPPTITVSASPAIVTEGVETSAYFILTFSHPLGTSSYIRYDLTGTATNGADYRCETGGVYVNGYESSATIFIDLGHYCFFDDTAIEGDETIALTVQPSYNNDYQLDPLATSATITIHDNDQPPPTVNLSGGNWYVVEPATPEQETTVTYIVGLMAPHGQDVVVRYALSGTATAGSDYAEMSGLVTIPAGSDGVPLVIRVLSDTVLEGEETVVVTLCEDPQYQLEISSMQTIIVDAACAPRVWVEAGTPQTSEEDDVDAAMVTFFRDGATAEALTVYYTLSGSATNGQDYELLSGQATFLPYESTANLYVFALDDPAVEGTETVTVTLTTAPADQPPTTAP